MSLVRTVAFAAAAFLLAGGYLASQWAYFNGTAARYAMAVDSPSVRALALVLLVLCVASAFVKQEAVE